MNKRTASYQTGSAENKSDTEKQIVFVENNKQ